MSNELKEKINKILVELKAKEKLVKESEDLMDDTRALLDTQRALKNRRVREWEVTFKEYGEALDEDSKHAFAEKGIDLQALQNGLLK